LRDWQKVLLSPDDTLLMAINILQDEPAGIVLVVDKSRKLLGTITDGDVRRGLLKFKNMNITAKDIMCKQPHFALHSSGHEKIISLIKELEYLHMPLVDSKGCVVGLEILKDISGVQRYDNPVFLMAGGKGKRLGSLTKNTPKPLLKVGADPILQTILEQFVQIGFHDFYISTCYKGQMIREYFGNGDKWGVKIRYVNEDKPMGTAGALGLLPKNLQHIPIIMMNGDLLTKLDFGRLLKFHEENDGLATMCVREYEVQVPYGVIKAEGYRVAEIIEKPSETFFVNAGIYVLDPAFYKNVNTGGYLDMPELIQNEVEKGGEINMFPIHEPWADIGHVEEIEKARQNIVIAEKS
tara:strand:- start:39591 stop:40646 length:1056 start_codon:yes stop_codon:yes gene_type:complete